MLVISILSPQIEPVNLAATHAHVNGKPKSLLAVILAQLALLNFVPTLHRPQHERAQVIRSRRRPKETNQSIPGELQHVTAMLMHRVNQLTKITVKMHRHLLRAGRSQIRQTGVESCESRHIDKEYDARKRHLGRAAGRTRARLKLSQDSTRHIGAHGIHQALNQGRVTGLIFGKANITQKIMRRKSTARSASFSSVPASCQLTQGLQRSRRPSLVLENCLHANKGGLAFVDCKS